jgi:hypothetical protein
MDKDFSQSYRFFMETSLTCAANFERRDNAVSLKGQDPDENFPLQ